MGCCGDSSDDVQAVKINGHVLTAPIKDDFNGPIKNRVCRDVIMLILFIAFCTVGVIYLIVTSTKGDIDRIIHGYDNFGNVCGKSNTKYFPDIPESGIDQSGKAFLNIIPPKTCVKECANTSQTIGFFCLDMMGVQIGQSSQITNRVKSLFEDFAANLRRLAGAIVGVCAISVAISFIFILLLRFLAPVIVWLTVAIIALGTIAGTIFLWIYWSELKKVEIDKNKLNGFLAAAIFATIFTVMILVLLIAMRNRIRLVIQLFTEAGKAIASMPLLLIQPLWTLIAMAVVSLVWIYGWVLIESSGDPYIIGENAAIGFKRNLIIDRMRWYHVFGFLWVSQFVIACQCVTVAGAVSTWYFSRDKSKLGSPILISMWRLIRYHMGSVAFGSLIIAIVKMIRLLFKYVEGQMKNSALSCCLKCCQCCLYCFEKFLKYLTRNAYIEIAIYGYSFCTAAQKAFAIIASNALRVATINFVGDFVLFLVKASIVLLSGYFGYLVLKAANGGSDAVGDLVGPMIICVLFSYLIAYCFISIYEMAIDTLFLCFCEDCLRNDGLEKPYFMSKGLMKFVENSKKALEAMEHRKNIGNQPQIQTVMPMQQYPGYPQMLSAPPTYREPGAHSGLTPLHPGYPPISEPPSPSQFLPTK